MTDDERRHIVLVEASLRELLSLMDHADSCDTCVIDMDHEMTRRLRIARKRASSLLKTS